MARAPILGPAARIEGSTDRPRGVAPGTYSATMRCMLLPIFALLAGLANAAASAPPPATGPAPTTHGACVFPFIADDYAKAIAEARARKVPLFIESWAPW